MSVGNRIRALRRSLNMSQPELAKRAGVGQSTVSDLENDKKGTSAEKMDAISAVLGTTSKYLLTGNDEVITSSDLKIIQSAKNALSNDDVEIKYFEDIAFSCGSGSFAEAIEKEAKRITISRIPLRERNISKDNCIAIPAVGDSMFPTIKDKDIVYVDLGRSTIKDGKIFAVCHGGLFKFKRLYQLPLGGIRIVSDNIAEYPEERLTAQEIIDQQFEVIGWAWSWQSMENW
ncbi:XRE family transcriptional regulator [Acinetobacter indicus]|uniref:XRE family transcriptional regulator n=1 Tax=Acinetobacter indicus TaxID=756892 RepID=UPI0012E0F6ED|nr:LexA family transcriptional regulator [Acinetobacter indicus]